MNRTSNNRSGLFLLEIMIAILFFAMVSAVCLRSFAKAHTLSQEASDMSQAMSHMENVAELLKSADNTVLDDSGQTVKLLNTEYALVSTDQKQYVLYFSKDWENCSAKKAAYTILIQGSDPGSKNIRTYTITTSRTKDDTTIDQLTLELYTKKG